MAVAVGIFRHEQIIADQQRRLHRAGGNVEGLEQEGTDDQRDQQGVDDDAYGLATISFRFWSRSHAHHFSILPKARPPQTETYRSREQHDASRPPKGIGPDSDSVSQFRRKPEFARWWIEVWQ